MQNISSIIETAAQEMFNFLADKFPVACASDEFYFFPHYVLPDQNWKTWDNFSDESIAETCSYLSSFESELEYCNTNPADRKENYDKLFLSCFTRTLREQLTEYKIWKRQPSFYLTITCLGLEQALGSGNPDAVHDRASGLPAFLDQARLNLCEVPEIYADIAGQMLADIIEFIRSLVPRLPELIFALPALERFSDSLSEVQVHEHPVLPVEAYEKLLRDHFTMNLSLKEIEELIDLEYREMNQVLQEESGKLSPRRSKHSIPLGWTDIYNRLPEPDIKVINKILLYRSEIEELRRHCNKYGLIPGRVDDRCPVKVSSLPPYLSAIRSSSSYSISPGIPVPGGTFFVPENPGATEQYQEELREYRMLTAHETWPGHHLLDACRFLLVSKTRRFIERPLFYEGWACFGEELCNRTGYFTGPGDRLILAKRRFWRAARGKVDIGLNTGRLNILSAGEYLKKAGIPVERALSSVRKYTLNPGYQLCYTIGLRRFLDLFDKCGQHSISDFTKTVLLNGETFTNLISVI